MKEELLKEDDATKAWRYANELNQARDAITVLQTSVISKQSRINTAISMLWDMMAGADEDRQREQCRIIKVLEGRE
jgi:hypothetical protein